MLCNDVDFDCISVLNFHLLRTTLYLVLPSYTNRPGTVQAVAALSNHTRHRAARSALEVFQFLAREEINTEKKQKVDDKHV